MTFVLQVLLIQSVQQRVFIYLVSRELLTQGQCELGICFIMLSSENCQLSKSVKQGDLDNFVSRELLIPNSFLPRYLP